MFTECPTCHTTFRLSADDLRRAQGKVRCGNCSAVFNALESLAEDEPVAATDPESSWLTSSERNPHADMPTEADILEAEQAALDPDADSMDPDATDQEAGSYGILHIGSDENETPAEQFISEKDQVDDTIDGVAEQEVHEEAKLAGTDEEAFHEPDDFDEGTWDRIPGVGALEADTPHEPDTNALEYEHYVSDNPSESQRSDEYNQEVEEYSATSTEAANYEAHKADQLSAEGPEVTEEKPDEESLEFDVPAESWPQFFDADKSSAGGMTGAGPELNALEESSIAEARESLTALADKITPDESEAIPPWREDRLGRNATESAQSSRFGLLVLAGLSLIILFGAQLIHYNRDDLAAHPQYGELVRSAYARLGQELYPTWPLFDGYEIRGAEAVAGESGPNVLDIRTQIAATGNAVVGLPRLRVVLKDRWSNPVAARDFSPEEYAKPEDIPPLGLLPPGAIVGAHLSILDPGAGAQGFELELCLPRRDTGLECTDQPFR